MGLLNSNSLNEWLTGIPERAREAYRGLLNAPSEVKQLFDPQFQQGLLKNATPINREDIINQGLNISGMAPYGMAGHIVYHGSPHKFNKFDMSKIGTGEGAQAYGHGLYFAESPKVAASYRDNLTSGLSVTGYDAEAPAEYAARLVKQWGSPEKAMSILDNAGERMPTGRRLDFYNAIKDGSYKASKEMLPEGQLYKVDIPDEAIAKMLDWDRSLDQQPQEVRDIFMQMVPKPGTNAYYDDLLLAAPMKKGGGDEYKAPLSRFYQGLGSGSHADLSKSLKDKGIPGIRYLDGFSRADGSGSYNYVLFDDQLPRILEINGQPTGLLSWADEAKIVRGLLGEDMGPAMHTVYPSKPEQELLKYGVDLNKANKLAAKTTNITSKSIKPDMLAEAGIAKQDPRQWTAFNQLRNDILNKQTRRKGLLQTDALNELESRPWMRGLLAERGAMEYAKENFSKTGNFKQSYLDALNKVDTDKELTKRISAQEKDVAEINKIFSSPAAKDWHKSLADKVKAAYEESKIYESRFDKREVINAAAKKATLEAIQRKTKKMLEVEYLSAKSSRAGGSVYLKNPKGEIVRVSDHYLPDTPQREYNRSIGLNGRWDREVIIDDWREKSIDDYIKEIIGEVNGKPTGILSWADEAKKTTKK